MFNEKAAVFYRVWNHRPKFLDMKLDMQENQMSHAFRIFLLRTTLTEEDMASCSRGFRKPKIAEEERKLIENATPKSTHCITEW